jgi:hypothetical protein
MGRFPFLRHIHKIITFKGVRTMKFSNYVQDRCIGTHALTRLEASVFGIPYPLVTGWFHIYGGLEVTEKMIRTLQQRIATGKPGRVARAAEAVNSVLAKITGDSRQIEMF